MWASLLSLCCDISKPKGPKCPPPSFVQGISLLKSRQKKPLNAAVSRSGIMSLPVQRIHNNGSRMRHISLQKRFPGLRGPIQPGRADGLSITVICPEQVITDPVHRDALHVIQLWRTERN